jgi:eukaryotic-like serine/threonine-protein kinase
LPPSLAAMNWQSQLQSALAGRYDVEHEIGAGGMATVFLARDVKHDRKVALKMLNADLGAVLGVERFLAEIKVTANLQHPNLLPLFDSGEANGLLFYVMPFVEGESLRARLEREKQLPIDEAVRITSAIAAALDYAHRRGVIHRDLKPENILLQDGQPLLADFGIALAVSNAGGNRITQTGLSLGTPQYMSPEQATGDRAIDGRTDIYSLGAILFEMLSGDPPYVGSTSQAVIARVLTEPPRSVRALRNTVPEYIDAAVERTLAKLPADRFATAHEFANALHGDVGLRSATVERPLSAPARRTWRSSAPWIVAGLGIAVAAAATINSGIGNRAPPVIVSTITAPVGQEFSEQESMGAMSPDGKQLAFIALGPRGETQLWMRRLDTLSASKIVGTEGAVSPFWSPDGKSIGYFVQGWLVVGNVAGGMTRQICELTAPYAGSWGTTGTIAVATDSGIFRVKASGGTCNVAIKRDSSGYGPRHVWMLPDGRHVLFTNQVSTFGIYSGDLDAGTSHALLDQISDPSYVAPGILLYGAGGDEGKGRIWARRFDASRLTFSGEAVALTAGVRTAGGVFAYAASDGAALAYLPGRGDNGVIITDRSGRILDTVKVDGGWMYRWARSHPWLAAVTKQPLAKVDIERHTQTVLSRNNGVSPVWSPADSLVATGLCGIYTNECGLLLTRLSDGKDSLIVKLPMRGSSWPSWWSSDGRYLVYTLTAGFSARGGQIWVYDFSTHTAAPIAGLQDGAIEATVSPDNRWIAYRSLETGTWEVYVRPFQRSGEAVRVSTAGGRLPQWNTNGRELFFQAPDGWVMSCDVQTAGAQFAFTPPRQLLMAPAWTRHTFFDIGTSYDVRPDGQRFAFRMSATGSDETGTSLVLVQNWRSLLK